MSLKAKRILLHEDWTVVLLGLVIILLSLTGINVKVPASGWNDSNTLLDTAFSQKNIFLFLVQFVFVVAIATVGAFVTSKKLLPYIGTFFFVYLLTIVSIIIAGNGFIKSLNLEPVIFSLIIGLLIGNIFRLPSWIKDSLTAEFFVKIGLVLLGTTIIFSDIVKSGFVGLVQALVVVISVWYFAFWVSKKLGIDDEMSLMISSAVSICGVSAAIATAGAIKGDSKKLSYIISLVLVCAIPMMIGMPYIASSLGLSQTVTGAWLGGTIDTTGAVAAAGTLVGEEALKISTIVKFSQNVLLGIAAFIISLYWAYNKKGSGSDQETQKPSLKIIWERFPKFVIGFVAASLLFSFFINTETINSVKGNLKAIQNLWFVLAFTSIGLETRFADFVQKENKKPLVAFLVAQLFNILITLLIAYLLFK